MLRMATINALSQTEQYSKRYFSKWKFSLTKDELSKVFNSMLQNELNKFLSEVKK